MPTALTLLEQREIEAKILGPFLRAFAEKFGEEQIRLIAQEVIHDLGFQSGCMIRKSLGNNSLVELGQAVSNWQQGDSLSLEILASQENELNFNVRRCAFAEMYDRLGLKEWGDILSCGRDAAMIQGFNPNIELKRTQTIMQGDSHCDFRYSELTKSSKNSE